MSVENRRFGLPRVEELRRSPGAVRFLSIEPLLEDLGDVDLTGIDWVIVGGESGPGARRLERAWVERIRAECTSAEVPFFFKQWGGPSKKKTGRSLDGKTYDAMPPLTRASVLPDPERTAQVDVIERWADAWRTDRPVLLRTSKRSLD